MSAKSKHPPAEGLLSAGVLFAIRALILVAIAVDGYLLWASLSGGSVAGCGPESGCDKVLHSRWAYWLGLPVSVPALLVYVAIFGVTFRLGRHTPVAHQRQAWRVLVPAAILVIGAGVWFVLLQIFAIKALCPFCMTAHTAGMGAALFILFHAPLRQAPEIAWQVEKFIFLTPAVAKKLCFAALGGLALLVAGQTLHQKKAFEVTSMPGGLLSTTVSNAPVKAAVPAASNASAIPVAVAANPPPSPPAPSGRRLQLHGGAFEFDLAEVPVIGPRDAPFVMLSLFDYSCSHCRTMHGHLMEAHRAVSNQLAIVSLPMPLDPACNYTVRNTPPDHTNACAYSRIGLAVWRAGGRKQEQFDDWIFAPPKPPPLAEVRQFAETLVGKSALAAALNDPWVERQLRQTVNIYATNLFHLGRGNMPQLIIGTNIVMGNLRGPQDLFPLLAANLGLQVNPPGVAPNRPSASPVAR